MTGQDLLDLLREKYPYQEFYLVVEEGWVDPCELELDEEEEATVMRNLSQGVFED